MFCCRRVVIDNENEMPNDYGTTPGGTIFGTTPGGILFLDFEVLFYVQVNLFQKPSFLHYAVTVRKIEIQIVQNMLCTKIVFLFLF